MTNTIKVLNNNTFAEITTIENITSPLVYEEINGSYTFSFDVAYFDTQHLVHPNLIEVEGQYYRINRISKDHNTTISVKVDCEHISYELIGEEDFTEEYDDTASGMITSILANTGFNIGTVMATESDYYKPSSTSVRQRLFDVANLFGGELIFDNFTVSLVSKRGQNNGLKFELGENLVGVTEEIDNSNGYPIYSYEVDVIDLSQIKGHEKFASVGLGDTIQVIDPLLNINVTYRVLSYERDPFQKINPKIQIGNLIRDFTDYIRQENEDDEEDVDPTQGYFLKNFTIGKVNCLLLDGIEFEYDTVLPDDISTSVDYFVLEQHKGLSIELKSQYSSYHVTVTKFYEDNTFQDFNLSSISNEWKFPEKNLVALNVTVSQVPLSEINLDVHKVKNYGVTFNKTYIEPFREFKIGNKNVLGMSAIVDSKDESFEIDDITASLEYSVMQQYEGVKLSLRREFKDYSTSIITFDKNGIPTPYNYETFKDKLPTLKLPTDDIQYFMVAVSEVPEAEFNPLLHKTVQYGVKFDKVPFEPLAEFSIGNTDCLRLSEVSFDEKPSLIQVKAEVYYSEYEELTGLKIRLNKDYKSFYTRITTYDNKEKPTTRAYEDILNNKFPTKDIAYMIIEVLENPPSTFNPSNHLQAYYAIKFTNKNGEEDKSGVKYYIESETVNATNGGAIFNFSVPYDDVISVTLGVGQVEQEEPITAYWTLIQGEDEMYTGVNVEVKGLIGTGVDVSVQAVVQEGVEETEEEGEPNG